MSQTTIFLLNIVVLPTFTFMALFRHVRALYYSFLHFKFLYFPHLHFAIIKLKYKAALCYFNCSIIVFSLTHQITTDYLLAFHKRTISHRFRCAGNLFTCPVQWLGACQLSLLLKSAHPLHPLLHMSLPFFRRLL